MKYTNNPSQFLSIWSEIHRQNGNLLELDLADLKFIQKEVNEALLACKLARDFIRNVVKQKVDDLAEQEKQKNEQG